MFLGLWASERLCGQRGRARRRAVQTIFGAAVLLGGLVAAPAQAQLLPGVDTDEEEAGAASLFEAELEATILAATKTLIPVSKAPGAVTVITNREIRASGARTIGELLRVTAGMDVRWGMMQQIFMIRGFGETPFTSRVLLLIDGVPYNSWNKGGFPPHPGLDFFVLQQIKRIEIIRSPGSALYGEDAYWGVVNIVSLSGDDIRGGEVSALAGSLDTVAGSARWGDKIGEKGSLLVTAKYLDSIIPREFWIEDDLKNKALDFYAKGTYGPLQVSYYRHQSEQDGFEKSIEPLTQPPFGSWVSAPQIKQTVNIAAAKLEQPLADGKYSIGGDLAWANRHGHHCAACHSVTAGPALFEQQEDHGYQLLGEVRLGVHNIPNNNLLLGAEFRRRDAGDHVNELGGHHPGDDIVTDYNKVAVYAQDQISLANDKLNLYVGARYDFESDLWEDDLSPRISAVFNPVPPVALRAGWGRARRLPNFFELYQDSFFIVLGQVPLVDFRPNPDLQPEKIETFELGGEYRFKRRWLAKLDLFRSRVSDFIIIDRIGYPPEQMRPEELTHRNHPDDGILWGGELEVRGQISSFLTGFANYSYQKTEADKGLVLQDTGTPLEIINAPEHKLNLGVYMTPVKGFSGSADLQWRDDYFAPRGWYFIQFVLGNEPTPEPFKLGAHAFVNFRLSYDVPVNVGGLQRPLRLSLYGRNIFDERAIEYADAAVRHELLSAGRQFFGEITFNF
jgi:outer membrane receptor for ferrienterochelin and colicins